jgi:hypothetical protein
MTERDDGRMVEERGQIAILIRTQTPPKQTRYCGCGELRTTRTRRRNFTGVPSTVAGL